MPDHEDDEWRQFWKSLALWACGAIIVMCGVAVGLWSKSLDERLDGLAQGQRRQWEVLGERATLPPRLAEVERKTEDQEERIRKYGERIGRLENWGERFFKRPQ